ncbi:hypothetical protein CYY_003040 [Polysphondylium violaceum]|uniref:Uncharacterized protein n=1 Tax=Polysphondylium violaceum TaxID=133409 RepID=A0A8J4PZ44_9MYCE|nr:hypothetical protein CYY_003040 [Polysphondylium violaceum]
MSNLIFLLVVIVILGHQIEGATAYNALKRKYYSGEKCTGDVIQVYVQDLCMLDQAIILNDTHFFRYSKKENSERGEKCFAKTNLIDKEVEINPLNTCVDAGQSFIATPIVYTGGDNSEFAKELTKQHDVCNLAVYGQDNECLTGFMITAAVNHVCVNIKNEVGWCNKINCTDNSHLEYSCAEGCNDCIIREKYFNTPEGCSYSPGNGYIRQYRSIGVDEIQQNISSKLFYSKYFSMFLILFLLLILID